MSELHLPSVTYLQHFIGLLRQDSAVIKLKGGVGPHSTYAAGETLDELVLIPPWVELGPLFSPVFPSWPLAAGPCTALYGE